MNASTEGSGPAYDRFGGVYHAWAATVRPYTAIELYSFFSAVGPVQGLHVLDLAAGEGRIARLLAAAGAASVTGGEISPEMVRRAREQEQDGPQEDDGEPAPVRPRYIVLDGADPDFQLEAPVDLVTSVHLFPYAGSEQMLQRMADLMARNLKPGGRMAAYTAHPEYDFGNPDPRLERLCGFSYAGAAGNRRLLVIGGQQVDIWQWSRAAYERCLARAGFDEIRWHDLHCPPDRPEVAAEMAFYLENPSCIALSACKAGA